MLRVLFVDPCAVRNQAMLRLGLAGHVPRCTPVTLPETPRDGVYTHGLNRLTRFQAMIGTRAVNVHAVFTRMTGSGVERKDAPFASALPWIRHLALFSYPNNAARSHGR